MRKKHLIAVVFFITASLFSYSKVNAELLIDSPPLEQRLYFKLNTANTTRYTGNGVKVAVLDSGIDVNHGDLKARIIGGYDFVENKTIYMDGDYKKGHGTHVAGIVGANGKMKGIAPEASLLIYRVVTNENNPDKIYKNVVEAIKMAVSDGAQVINISAKVDNYIQGDELDLEIKRAKEKGIIVVKSNGNAGPNLWTTYDLACSPDVISVGNATMPYKQPIFKNDNEEILLKLGDNSSEFMDEGKISYLGKVPRVNIEKTDLKKKIVIMNTSDEKLKEREMEVMELVKKLKTSGCSGLILVGVDGSDYAWQFIYEGLPIAFVKTQDAGKFNRIIQSKNGKLTNELYQEIFFQSSRGPSKNNMLLKPDISAPGTKILSTTINNDYIYNTGTSMSAPYITGTIALIKQAHNDWGFDEIKASMINNANVLRDEQNKIVSVLSQGAGVVNIEKSINSDVFIICDNLSFNLSTKDQKEKAYEIKIKNSSKTMKNYNIRIEKITQFKGIDINIPSNINIKSESLEKFFMNVKIDKNTPDGIYEGILWFENNQEEKHVPFIILVNQK